MTRLRRTKLHYTEEELEVLRSMNEKYIHVTYGSDSDVYAKSINEHGQTSWECINARQFPQRFLHKPLIKGENAGKAWLKWQDKEHREGVYFYPSLDSAPSILKNKLNTYIGLNAEELEGDVTPFLELGTKLISTEEESSVWEYVLDWIAHLIQKPTEKTSVAIALQGVPGGGKGSFVEPLLRIVGAYGKRLNGASMATGRFNAVIDQTLLLFLDEVSLLDTNKSDRLKALISEPELTVEPKGKEPRVIKNYSRLILATNDRKIINASKRERRYLIVETGSALAQNTEFFSKYHDWLENNGVEYLLYYLRRRDIRNFNPHCAPKTSVLRESILSSQDTFGRFVINELNKSKPFGGGPLIEVSSIVNQFKAFADRELPNMTQAAARSIVGKRLKELGVPKIKGPSTTCYELKSKTEFALAFANDQGLKLADFVDEGIFQEEVYS